MSNELAELLREAASEIRRPMSEYGRELKHRLNEAAAYSEAQEQVGWTVDPLYRHPPPSTELEAQEPVVKVHRNEAGQISLRKPNGDYFDMSKHIGESFYRHPPPSTELEAQEPDTAIVELVRVQHEALSVMAEANDNDISGGFMTPEEVAMYRAALAKYNEMMGEGNEQ